MGKIAESIRQKLIEGLAPTELIVDDDSARHAGHSGATPDGESHFNVTVVSPAFDGVRPLERQRMVHRLVADELAGPVHALSLTLRGAMDS